MAAAFTPTLVPNLPPVEEVITRGAVEVTAMKVVATNGADLATMMGAFNQATERVNERAITSLYQRLFWTVAPLRPGFFACDRLWGFKWLRLSQKWWARCWPHQTRRHNDQRQGLWGRAHRAIWIRTVLAEHEQTAVNMNGEKVQDLADDGDGYSNLMDFEGSGRKPYGGNGSGEGRRSGGILSTGSGNGEAEFEGK
jgi:hypothetical protein